MAAVLNDSCGDAPWESLQCIKKNHSWRHGERLVSTSISQCRCVGFDSGYDLTGWRLHALPVPLWVFSGNSGFCPVSVFVQITGGKNLICFSWELDSTRVALYYWFCSLEAFRGPGLVTSQICLMFQMMWICGSHWSKIHTSCWKV